MVKIKPRLWFHNFSVYLKQLQFAFDPVPIRHQKPHYYGTDYRSTVVLRYCHLLDRYFEWQPEMKNFISENVVMPFIINASPYERNQKEQICGIQQKKNANPH